MSCNTENMGLNSIKNEIIWHFNRLRRQATPPSPEEVDQQEEIGEPRSPVVATQTPTPMPTSTEVPVQLEKPSVQQLLAQPGFSSGVLIHTGPRHPQFASLASRCNNKNYKTSIRLTESSQKKDLVLNSGPHPPPPLRFKIFQKNWH